MASLILLGRVRGVRSIFSRKETFLAPVRIAASGRRCMSQEKPISRFPVPIRDTLPQDIQQRMNEVEEKVRSSSNNDDDDNDDHCGDDDTNCKSSIKPPLSNKTPGPSSNKPPFSGE